MLIRLVTLFYLLAAPALAAIGPEEVMEDPALQARAMQLYEDLRCVKCRSENIASSNADWARDARGVVRERLLAGDSDAQVLAYFEARYGEYVLMNPPVSTGNIGLWLAGPLALLLGAAIAAAYLRTRRQESEPVRTAAGGGAEVLSAAERAELDRILSGEGRG